MPNRIIKESICTSDNLTQLDWGAQLFFLRLTVQCDDFGRFDGRPAILRARCYPLELDRVTNNQIIAWLRQLEQTDLVQLYEIDGKPYLQISTWRKHQQVRADKSKYPDMPAVEPVCQQVIADDSNGKQTQANVHVSVSENEIVSESENVAPAVATSTPPPSVQAIVKRGKEQRESVQPLVEAYCAATGDRLDAYSEKLTDARRKVFALLAEAQRDGIAPGDLEWLLRWRLGDPAWKTFGAASDLKGILSMYAAWVQKGKPHVWIDAKRAAVRRGSDAWTPEELAAGREADEGAEWPHPPE